MVLFNLKKVFPGLKRERRKGSRQFILSASSLPFIITTMKRTSHFVVIQHIFIKQQLHSRYCNKLWDIAMKKANRVIIPKLS